MQCKGWRGNLSWDGRRNVKNFNILQIYLSYNTKCICINLQNIFVCNDMQCNLSSDGRRNVKNFNILPPLGEMHQEFFYKFKEKFQNQWSMQEKRITCQNWKIFLGFISSRFFFRRRNQLEEEATYLFWPSSAYRPVSDLKAKHQKRNNSRGLKIQLQLQQPNRHGIR